jgi:hypothetical protein
MQAINNFVSLKIIDNSIIHFRLHKIFPSIKEYQKMIDFLSDKLEQRINSETLIIIFDVKVLTLFTVECQTIASDFAQFYRYHSVFVIFYNTNSLIEFSLKEMRKGSDFPFPIFTSSNLEEAKFKAEQILLNPVY